MNPERHAAARAANPRQRLAAPGHRTSRPLLQRAAAFAFALSALLQTAASRSEALDPSLPHDISVGFPAGLAPTETLDAAHTRRSSIALPHEVGALWKTRLSGGIEFSPVVDGQGNIVVTHAEPRVTQVTRNGVIAWTTDLGDARPATGPVLLSDGTRLVVTLSGACVGLNPSGTRRFETQPGLASGRPNVVPLDDGGALIAAGTELVRMDRNGHVWARVRLNTNAAAALQHAGQLFVATTDGAIWQWSPPAPPQRWGSFGGAVHAQIARRNATLVATVDGQRLVTFDLSTKRAQTRFDAAPAELFSDLAVTLHGYALLTRDGFVVHVSEDGKELARASLDPAHQSSRPAGSVARYFAPSVPGTMGLDDPVFFVGRDGTTVIASSAIGLGVARAHLGPRPASEGATHGKPATKPRTQWLDDLACFSPEGLVPAGRQRFVLACRSGLLSMIGTPASPGATSHEPTPGAYE